MFMSPTSYSNTVFFSNSQRQINNQLSKSIKRLTTGMRVAEPHDDFYAYNRAKEMENDISAIERIERDLGDSKELVNTAMDSITSIKDTLYKMEDLAQERKTAGLSDSEKNALNNELQELIAELDSLANSASYDGTNMVNAAGSIDIYLNEDYSQSKTLTFTQLTASDLSVDALNIDKDQGDAVIDAAITSIETAIGTVTEDEGNFSGYLNTNDSHLNLAASKKENITSAQSSVIGVDAAYETARYTAMQIQKEIGQSMIAQFRTDMRSVLKLFS